MSSEPKIINFAIITSAVIWCLVFLHYILPKFSIRDDAPRPKDDKRVLTTHNGGDTHSDDDEWKTIHVYVGNLTNGFSANKVYRTQPGGRPLSRWHSQARQDRFVTELHKGKRDGFFVDLAANDAVKLSNTLALERDYGWNGICLEANPVYWLGLAKRRCTVVGAVFGANDDGVVSFSSISDKGNPYGRILKHLDKNVISDRDVVDPRNTVSLETTFKRYNVPPIIDYFSLDVEGAELQIMENFPFHMYTILVLTVERPGVSLENLLKANGMVYLRELGSVPDDKGGFKFRLDQVWIHKSIAETAGKLQVPW